MFRQQLDEMRKVGQHIHWPRLDPGEHSRMKVLDGKRHLARLAKSLTRVKQPRTKALILTIPQSRLLRADEVIQ
jgi:hypothetical protein